MPISSISRFQGCLLGLAAGDALGTTLEFKVPGSFSPINTIVGGGPFNLQAGQWTDDTSMALCLAQSLLHCDGMNLKDQLTRYTRWYREGYLSSTGHCFDIGNTVSQALRRFESTGESYCGATDKFSAGNGSLMRLAPVPLFYASDEEAAINYSAESSRTTHGATAAIDACKFFAKFIVRSLTGATKEELLDSEMAAGLDLCPVIQTVVAGSYKEKSPPQIKGTGYVVESLEAALWAFHHSTDFRSGALLAVNLGDDADTTGAIYGQLAGAHYGVDSIPSEWRNLLTDKEMLLKLAANLHTPSFKQSLK